MMESVIDSRRQVEFLPEEQDSNYLYVCCCFFFLENISWHCSYAYACEGSVKNYDLTVELFFKYKLPKLVSKIKFLIVYPVD